MLRRLVAKDDPERTHPILELLLPATKRAATAEKNTNAWLLIDAREVLHRHGIIELPEPYRGDTNAIVECLLGHVEASEEKPEDRQFFLLSLMLIDPSLLNPTIRRRLLALPPLGEATGLADPADALRRRVLNHRALLFAGDRDEAGFMAMIEAEIDKVTARLGRHARFGYDLVPGDPATNAYLVIADIALSFAALIALSREELIDQLARTIENVAERWPGALHGSLAVLDHAVRGVSIADGDPAWHVIHRLRRRGLSAPLR